MTQALDAHTNNKTIKKKTKKSAISHKKKKKTDVPVQAGKQESERADYFLLHPLFYSGPQQICAHNDVTKTREDNPLP
jgi:hypothetical protein